jgi:hypothetical protein
VERGGIERKIMRTTIAYVLACSWLCACSKGNSGNDPGSGNDSIGSMPYQLGQALVIGESANGELVSVDEDCDTAACQAVRERCGDSAYADVVVDEDGEVLDVLCFRGNATVQEIGPDAVATASAGNDTVLVLDGADDGVDVTGDVVLSGNNAVLYGRGADVSQVGGSVTIEKNNAIVRGVSILGDLTLDKNNAQLSFTEIHGDVTISGNNTTLAECVIFGQLHITGVNTVLVQNRFQGPRALSGKNLTCNGNTSFEGAPADAADAGATDAGPTDAGTSPAAADAGSAADVTCERSNGRPDGRGKK